MFDIGWTEMALIAVVAVVVIGPKELPKVMREIGTWVARARAMSRVFMEQLDEMSRQTGIDELRKEAESLRQLNPAHEIEKMVDPDGVIARQTAELAQIGATVEAPPPQPVSPPDEATPPVADQPVTQSAEPTPDIPPSAPLRAPTESAP